MTIKKLFKLLLAVLLIGQSGLLTQAFASEAEDDRLSVVASFYPIYEFTKNVGGDRIDLSLMVSGNASPHGYEPSAKDIVTLNEADVFVYSSDAMEFWANALLTNVDNEDLIVVSASNQHADHDHEDHEDHEHHEDHEEHEHHHEEVVNESEHLTVKGLSDHYHTGDVVTLEAITEEDVSQWQWQVRQNEGDWTIVEDQTTERFEYEANDSSFDIQVNGLNADGEVIVASDVLSAHIDNHEKLDPHSWLDLGLAQEQVNAIRDALIQADPEGESEYTENAAAYNQELQALDEEYHATFEGAKNRAFVVQHEAFGYLAKRYNLEQISVGGLSTEVEPSPARIGEITKTINEIGASYIYYQQGSNTSIAETIASETGTEIIELYDLEVAPEDQSLSYLDAMRHNLDALKMSIQ